MAKDLHHAGKALKADLHWAVACCVHLKSPIVGIGVQPPGVKLPVDFVLNLLHHGDDVWGGVKGVDFTVFRDSLLKGVVRPHAEAVGHAALLHHCGGHANHPTTIAFVPKTLPVWAHPSRLPPLLDPFIVQVDWVRRFRITLPFVGVPCTAEVQSNAFPLLDLILRWKHWLACRKTDDWLPCRGFAQPEDLVSQLLNLGLRRFQLCLSLLKLLLPPTTVLRKGHWGRLCLLPED
mmetsp:Transcript_1510/g.3041  ORF Transcript_1510/g.3041 Transcript_1510/m.3041 type:complete len:234 (-) Transcript_1510:104-805(-)